MTTGERIKERRKQLAISADTLAERVGVSRSTVFRWEKGEIEKIPAVELNVIAQALQTTTEYLIGWSDNPDPEADNEESKGYTIKVKSNTTRILAKGFDQMPEAARERALAMAKMIFEEYAHLFNEKGNDDDEN